MVNVYDVIICGAGPTGILLAAHLSRTGGVKVLLLEKAKGITTDPRYLNFGMRIDSRGICVDDETIRMVQGLGLYDKVYSEIGFTPDYFHFHPGGHDMWVRPILKGKLPSER
jgi:2-polyprenyl-6-methoxyphenol hydroxylase-like FAD-dependent oxidoreductase